MDPITRRLNESRNSRRLDEEFPAILNQLSSYEKEQVRSYLTKRAHIDIQNTPSELVKITSNRDPLLKFGGLLIFQIDPKTLAVSYEGKYLVDPYLYKIGNEELNTKFSHLSYAKQLAITSQIYALKYDPAKAERLKQVQQQRKDSMEGAVNRATGMQSYVRRGNFDKSGYELDKSKYQRMLAALGVKNVDTWMQRAENVFKKFGSLQNIISLDPDAFRMMSSLIQDFERLNSSKGDYDKAVANHRDDWWVESNRDQVVNALKILIDTIKKTESLLSKKAI